MSANTQILKDAAAACREGTELSFALIQPVVEALLHHGGSNEAKADFLRALTDKGETPAELAAFAKAILPHAVDPGVSGSWDGKPLIDCCGTGGGGLNLVNVSTGIVFILAAGGVPVVKHGNKGITKPSGSSDVLAALGIRTGDPAQVVPALETVGAAFLFAPAFHPSFKEIAPVRQELAKEGRRTVFNLLGPLLNPARPLTQMIGVFKQEYLDLFPPVCELLGRQRHLTVFGINDQRQPLGEVSAFGINQWAGSLGGQHIHHTDQESFDPAAFEDLKVDTPQDSARLLEDAFNGTGPEALRVMLEINAGFAFWIHGNDFSLEKGRARAREILQSKAAAKKLAAWRAHSPLS